MGSRHRGLIFWQFNDCSFCLRGFPKNDRILGMEVWWLAGAAATAPDDDGGHECNLM